MRDVRLNLQPPPNVSLLCRKRMSMSFTSQRTDFYWHRTDNGFRWKHQLLFCAINVWPRKRVYEDVFNVIFLRMTVYHACLINFTFILILRFFSNRWHIGNGFRIINENQLRLARDAIPIKINVNNRRLYFDFLTVFCWRFSLISKRLKHV